MNNSFELIQDVAKTCGCKILKNVQMSKYTTFKTGGVAPLFIEPESVEALSKVMKACSDENIKPFILGNGSNLLVADEGVSTVVIKLGDAFNNIELVGEDTIVCGAGLTLSKLCNFALDNSLTGLEFAFGIPGSCGGAAYMNAGAYGGEMVDVLVKCTHIDSNGNIGTLSGEELKLSYRHSAYTDSDDVIISLELKLKKGNYDDIRSKMNELIGKRRDKQPLEYPSAGSTFKRPEGYFAAALIEECGLKGKTIGGAQVSEKHSGFIINIGNATTNDILQLIAFVQKTVLEKKGVVLETEVKFIR
ncbi:MAG: UDP-N-acetylmuramate dehydrogenase [Clostridia bacterium]|nr:UDP-N-acetylmuramate dehydrogenase [Clostridia bacterium]